MPVGDVNSTERGSGARYNDDKPDMSLIPLGLVAISLRNRAFSHRQQDLYNALSALGDFQTTGEVLYLDHALVILSPYWGSCARVLEYGKRKYAEWNWAKGMQWSIPLACAARHALADLLGESLDPESGQPHIGHFMANVVMLRTFVDTFPEGNDLPDPALFRRPEVGGAE